MNFIPAKTIVTKSKSPDSWFGHDYNMNIYRGCCHGCIYCDSRSECYRVENFDEVRAKDNALALIDRELKSKRASGVVGTGAMSDPYNPFEKEMLLTRKSLELINAHGFGAAIVTKSDLVVRDADVLAGINEHSPVCVEMTITTYDQKLCGMIEPNAPPAAARFAALEKLSRRGLFCGILLMPVLPFINDTEENVSAIVKAAAEAGARFIYPWFGVTLRQNQRDYFYERINRYFPGMAARYWKVYGESYECDVPDKRRLYAFFSELCGRYGILYKMPDIIAAYKFQKRYRQMTLFQDVLPQKGTRQI